MDAYPRRVKKVGAGFVLLAPTRQAASIGAFSLSVFSNRKPAQRLRFEKEEQRRERAPIYKISRSKRYKACSDVAEAVGFEPTSP